MPEPPNTQRFDHGKTEVLTRRGSDAAAPDRPGHTERYVAGDEIARGGT